MGAAEIQEEVYALALELLDRPIEETDDDELRDVLIVAFDFWQFKNHDPSPDTPEPLRGRQRETDHARRPNRKGTRMSKTIWLNGKTLNALARRGITFDRPAEVQRLTDSVTGERYLTVTDGRKDTIANMGETETSELDFEPSAVLAALAQGRLAREGKANDYSVDDYIRAVNDVRERHPELYVRAFPGPSENVQGQETHDAAMALLASRGVHSPSYDELADAYIEVTS